MKKLSLYVFLVLMLCNVAKAKDLTGVELFCPGDQNYYYIEYDQLWGAKFKGFSFLSEKEVKFYETDDFVLHESDSKYTVSLEYIHVPPEKIDRQTLKISGGRGVGWTCQILGKEIVLKELLEKALEKIIKKQESLNKL